MSLSLESAIKKVNTIFATYSSAVTPGTLVGEEWKAGKVYEAWVLALVLERLEALEGLDVTLVGGTKVHLKSSPGPINPSYPHFRLSQGGVPIYAAWTDVEFATLSYARSGKAPPPGQAHRHELDLVIVGYGVSGFPSHDEVLIGVECKNTGFEKSMARAALGVRRELSLLTADNPTGFRSWPRATVPASPPSMLLVYSTDPNVVGYNDAGSLFGVDFRFEPMP